MAFPPRGDAEARAGGGACACAGAGRPRAAHAGGRPARPAALARLQAVRDVRGAAAPALYCHV